MFVRFARENERQVIFSAGDSVLARLSREKAEELCCLASEETDGTSFSGGIGDRMSEALLALRMAKALGRRRYVAWNELIHPDEVLGQ